MSPFRLLTLLALLVAPLSIASAQESSTASAQEVVFHRRPAQRGDTSRQALTCDLDLTMSIRQEGQVVQQQRQKLQRQQQRELTILRVAEKAPRQGQVTYVKSVVTLKTAEQDSQSTEQPVTGKSYLITREEDELSITYPDGGKPSEDELVIVQQNMDTFGLPNPIATFFDGKGVRIGQELRLPADLARDLLGFAATGNSVSQFGLKLTEVRPAPQGGSPLAIFEITLQANDPEQSGVSMTLNGQMAMEVETCRTLSVSLTGPVAASEMHGPAAGQYEVHSQGQIDVAVKADFVRR